MKLKTLKDLDFFWDEEAEDTRKRLKQLAIKWVKEQEKQDLLDDPYKTVPKWIRHFFNITEDDLK